MRTDSYGPTPSARQSICVRRSQLPSSIPVAARQSLGPIAACHRHVLLATHPSLLPPQSAEGCVGELMARPGEPSRGTRCTGCGRQPCKGGPCGRPGCLDLNSLPTSCLCCPSVTDATQPQPKYRAQPDTMTLALLGGAGRVCHLQTFPLSASGAFSLG